MGLRDRLDRLQKAHREEYRQGELAKAFVNHMHALSALCEGEKPPPAHPINLNPGMQGTFFSVPEIVNAAEVPDLSEE